MFTGWDCGCSLVSEFGENPAVLFRDLIDDRFLQVTREDAPGVGFDLEVGAEIRVVSPVGEEVAHMEFGGTEGFGGFRIKGNMEVDAGFAMIPG